MAREIAASIKINTSNAEGTISGISNDTEVLKDILKELQSARKKPKKKQTELEKSMQDLKDVFSKAAKLERSGLGGIGAAGGLMKALGIGAGGAAVAGGLGAALLGFLGLDAIEEKIDFPEFEKVINPETGAKNIAKIDTKTGKIIQYYTLQEAQQAQIVDKNGDLLEMYDSQNGILDRISGGLEKIDGYYVLATQDTANFAVLGHTAVALQEDINKSLKAIAEAKAEEAKRHVSKTVEEAGDFITYSDAFKKKYEEALIEEGTPVDFGSGSFSGGAGGSFGGSLDFSAIDFSGTRTLSRIQQEDFSKSINQGTRLMSGPNPFIDLNQLGQ